MPEEACIVGQTTYTVSVNRTMIRFAACGAHPGRIILVSIFDLKDYYVRGQKLYLVRHRPFNAIVVSGLSHRSTFELVRNVIRRFAIEMQVDVLRVEDEDIKDFLCPICLDTNMHRVVRVGCCRQLMHRHCAVESWLSKNACPMCRCDKCPICQGGGC